MCASHRKPSSLYGKLVHKCASLAALFVFFVLQTTYTVTASQQMQIARPCLDRYALMASCQPPSSDGSVGCPHHQSSCQHLAYVGDRCTVRIEIDGVQTRIHVIEGWWALWSQTESRRYFVYDGVHIVIDGFAMDRSLAFCGNQCGLFLEYYSWIDRTKSTPLYSRVVAHATPRTCFDCTQPTPTPDPTSIAQRPTRCVWRAFLPVAPIGEWDTSPRFTMPPPSAR